MAGKTLPQKIGKVSVKALLGAGGFGDVYRGEHPEYGEVAVKCVSTADRQDSNKLKRLEREWQTGHRLRHDNIVRVLAYEKDPKLGPHLIMELARGVTLTDWIAKAPQGCSEDAALAILVQLLDAVGYLWCIAGAVHRDIKPDNILFDEATGTVKLIDLGIAKRSEQSGMTKPGDTIGTLGYMSPEQLTAKGNLTVASDVYALGLCLYHMLAGREPFDGCAEPVQYVARMADEGAFDITKRRRQLLPDTVSLLKGMLNSDPGKRLPQDQARSLGLKALGSLTGHTTSPIADLARRRTIRPLFLSNSHYIEVDGEGYVRSDVAEGAFGIVIKGRIRGTASTIPNTTDGEFALKIPRLLADTARENAYIARLLEEESRAVRYTSDHSNVKKSSLIRALHGDFLRGRVRDCPGEQDGQFVLLQIRKGLPPRLCGVRVDEQSGNVLHLTAHGCDEIKRHGAELVLYSKSEAGCGTIALAASTSEVAGGAAAAFPLDSTFADRDFDTSWYAFAPSIAYEWGTPSLQEAISLDKLRTAHGNPWTLSNYLTLTERLLHGLHELHKIGIVHADVRPANILCCGGSTDDDAFKLIDYGSLASVVGEGEAAQLRSSLAAIGAAVAGGRRSPFYAPERNEPIELEDWDRAAFRQEVRSAPQTPGDPPCSDMVVVLGWRSSLSSDAKLSALLQQTKSTSGKLQEAIRPGDRIQLREFIFEVSLPPSEVEGHLVLRCLPSYWKVLNGRVVVPVEGAFPASWMPIPRLIVHQQWSVATDIYSIGALLLFFLYSPGRGQDGGNSLQSWWKFKNLIDCFGNKSYFTRVWKEATNLLSRIDDVLAKPAEKRQFEESHYDEAKRVAQRVQESVPGSHFLLKTCEKNAAVFLYVVHFCLCCLHRRDHLPSPAKASATNGPVGTADAKEAAHVVAREADDADGGKGGHEPGLPASAAFLRENLQPFCACRAESAAPGAKTQNDGPASRAAARLLDVSKAIGKLLEYEKFQLTSQTSEAAEKSSLELVVETVEQKAKIESLEKSVQTHKREIVSLQTALDDSKKTLKEARESGGRASDALKEKVVELHGSAREVARLQDCIRAVRSATERSGLQALYAPRIPDIKKALDSLGHIGGSAPLPATSSSAPMTPVIPAATTPAPSGPATNGSQGGAGQSHP